MIPPSVLPLVVAGVALTVLDVIIALVTWRIDLQEESGTRVSGANERSTPTRTTRRSRSVTQCLSVPRWRPTPRTAPPLVVRRP